MTGIAIIKVSYVFLTKVFIYLFQHQKEIISRFAED